MDPNFESHLDEIRSHPGLYIGQRSVIRLRAYIDGYCHAYKEMRGSSFVRAEAQEFEDWLCKKYKRRGSLGWKPFLVNATGWDQILAEITGNDKDAFELFGKLWDEFQTLKAAKKKGAKRRLNNSVRKSEMDPKNRGKIKKSRTE